jgi:hypothetical protein
MRPVNFTAGFGGMTAMLSLTLLLIFLCAQTAVGASPGDTVAACDPTQDIYFDNKLRFDYASTVRSIQYNNTFATVKLQWTDYNGPGSANYVFLRRGMHRRHSPQCQPDWSASITSGHDFELLLLFCTARTL